MLMDYNSKCSLSGLSFRHYSSHEVRKLSVKEITNPQSLDRLLNPVANGLYDLALGPLDKNDVCLTCHQSYFKCAGHFGHIALALPVYNPIFLRDLVKLLKVSCLSCHQLVASAFEKEFFRARMTLIDAGLLEHLPLVDDLYTRLVNSTDAKLLAKLSFRAEFAKLVDDIKSNHEHTTCSVRNVLKAKIEHIKEFMNSKLKATRQTCPNCTLPLRQLRVEHNSKLFYAKGVSARQIKKNKEKKMEMGGVESLAAADRLVDDLVDLQLDNKNNEENDQDDQEDDVNETTRIEDLTQAAKRTISRAAEKEANEDESDSKLDTLIGQTYLTPIETRKHLAILFENEKHIVGFLLGNKEADAEADAAVELTTTPGYEVFFFDALAVPPSKYRPLSQFKEQRFDNAQTVQLAKLLQQNIAIKEILNEIAAAAAADTVTSATQESTEKLISSLVVATGAKKAPSVHEKLQAAWLQMQTIVNVLYDSEMDKMNPEAAPPGLKQLLEKKEGLFRKHMMGKRVNYAGRSVISPDAFIDTDEIGIPEPFAKKLTYPQPVNAFNYKELAALVCNGPDVYPGACHVQFGNGDIVRLDQDANKRMAIAKQLRTPISSIDANLDIQVVHRHMRDGDVLLFNRQPTLHRPSVMAHKARVLSAEKTLRMHYSNCKSYNADFDGDEMNAHLPQNEVARAEAVGLMLSSEHYLVPKDGTPLGGLIHDHVVGGATLTMRDRFFDRSDYQSLVYNSFNRAAPGGRASLLLLPPAILRPRKLWTGKQVVSTLLINLLPAQKGALNLEGKAKISEKIWSRSTKTREPGWDNTGNCKSYRGGAGAEHMNEAYVLIRSGHLLSGVLDKAHYGSSSFSLVHCCYELYGGAVAGQLLSCLGRLFTSFLQLRGFTLGVEDILVKEEMSKPMARIVKKSKRCGFGVLAKAFGMTEQVATMDEEESERRLSELYKRRHLNPDDSYMKEIDLAYKGAVDSYQNSLTNICFPNGLIKHFPRNNLQLMIQSGAKGSSVNAMQMSCLLGQQELEGRRPRLMANGNTLPSFLPYDPAPASGGFIANSFMSGLTPQEYFFHCMAGREGLVDTAVKTSRSGYLQRCLIKHLEGIVVRYDLTVRDSDNSVIQFQYGEDSLSVEKTPFLAGGHKQFDFLADNHAIVTADRAQCEQIRNTCGKEAIYKKVDKITEWRKQSASATATVNTSNAEIGTEADAVRATLGPNAPFYAFSKIMASKESEQTLTSTIGERVQRLIDQWNALRKEERKLYKRSVAKPRLPITDAYHTDRYLGAVSETLQDAIDAYIAKRPLKFKDNFDEANVTSPAQKAIIQSNAILDKAEFRDLIYLKSLKSCITPGDSVGILAAQSIGEPSTQMTLNTFHFAGRGDMNVTLGIPRLREILMVASTSIKTPSMSVPVLDGRVEHAQALKSRFTRTLLWDCLNKIDVEQTLDLKYSSVSDTTRAWVTRVRFDLLPQRDLNARLSTPVRLDELLHYVETRFVKNLCIAINKKYNQISSTSLLHASSVRDKSMKNMRNINGGEGAKGDGGDDDDDDDDANGASREDVMESGESSGEKALAKRDDELEYVGEDEERNAIDSDDDDDNDDDDEKNNNNNNDDDDDDEGVEKDHNEEDGGVVEADKTDVLNGSMNGRVKHRASKSMDTQRVNRILSISDMIADYKYDHVGAQWFEITFALDALKPRLDLYTVIQKEGKHAYIAKVEGIKRCFLSQSTLPHDNGAHRLVTEGINVNEVIKNAHTLNASKLYLNDIHAMANTFGIEAATKVIINEMKQVFGAYGINVDYRHLSLIADYMTFEGVYKPFNRIGIKTNASPLQKMSFETCLQFFKDACLYGQHEDLKSPSARLVTGRMVNTGTGMFDVLTKLTLN